MEAYKVVFENADTFNPMELDASKAETVDELRRDIVSNSDISHSDLQSLAMNTDGGRLSLKVPLFESSANVENEYDAKFDEVLNAFNSNPNDPRILCVTLTESEELCEWFETQYICAAIKANGAKVGHN